MDCRFGFSRTLFIEVRANPDRKSVRLKSHLQTLHFFLRLFALTCRDSTNVAGAWMRRSDHLRTHSFTSACGQIQNLQLTSKHTKDCRTRSERLQTIFAVVALICGPRLISGNSATPGRFAPAPITGRHWHRLL